MDFDKIEREVNVDALKHQGRSIWPILKSYLIGITGDFKVIKESTLSNLRILVRNLIPDILSFRQVNRNDVWVFTNSERRYFINHASFDRISTGLLRYLDGYSLFENPIPKGRTRASSLQPGEKRIGMAPVYLGQYLMQKITKQPEIEDFEVLEEHLGTDLSRLKRIYRRILAGERILSWLIKLYRPKAIFVICYYSNFEVILAAKKNKVPILELQHGMLSEGHRAYFFKSPQDPALLPDFFLSFGSYSSDIVIRGNVFSPGQILDFGYSFLEEVEKNLVVSPQLLQFKSEYSTTVCITGQMDVTDVPLLHMIGDVCDHFPNTVFLFKPRFEPPEYLPEKINFRVVPDINTYELLKFCDCHITVYSTCAMESLFLGTPNLSIDIDGYYSRFLKAIIGKNPYNFEIYDRAHLIRVMGKLLPSIPEPIRIRESIANVFSPSIPSESFRNFFEEVVKKESDHQENTF